MHIGHALRLIRLSQGRTQESVALEANFQTSNLSRLERGEQTVTVDRLIGVANALKVKPSELFRMIEVQSTDGDMQFREVEVTYDAETQALYRAYGVLDSFHRRIVLRMIQDLAKAQRESK